MTTINNFDANTRDFWYFDDEQKEPLCFSSTQSDLKCDQCGDESLYHDSFAWAHGTTKQLLCEKCFETFTVEQKIGFRHVLTFH